MARRAAKVDANQAEIVDALRRAGASVQPLHGVGVGCPDLLIGFRGSNLLLEVKDGGKVPSARKLTEWQKKWHAIWEGQVCTVNSVDDAIAALGLVSQKIPNRGYVT